MKTTSTDATKTLYHLRMKHLAQGIGCYSCPQKAAVYIDLPDNRVRYLCPTCALKL